MKIFIFCFSLCFSRSLTIKYNVWNPEKYRLPKHIQYGVSTSAYQVEGAWNQDESADFIGINHYTTYYVNKPKPGGRTRKVYPHLPVDVNVELTQSDLWPQSKTPGIKLVPVGLYRTCMYLNQLCKRPLMIITEYGWSTGPGRNDTERVEVMFEFLKAMVYALYDEADIRGLTIWSLMDSIEWTAGTTQRYGLYEVDFESPNKTRSPRLSAHYFRNLAETGLVIENYTIPTNLSLDIAPRKVKARPQKITCTVLNVTIVDKGVFVNVTTNATAPHNATQIKTVILNPSSVPRNNEL